MKTFSKDCRAALELDVGHHGRILEDDPAPVDNARERLERAHAVPPAGLGEERLEARAAERCVLAREPRGPLGGLPDVRVRDRGVPDVEQAHPGVAGHPLAVAGDRPHRGGADHVRAEAVRAPGDDDARRHPLDVPLPRPGKRLVEVVGVEDEGSLGRCEEPEVADVRVAARLDEDVGAGRGREVEGHHGRGAAVVGEGRLRHALMAERHELLETVRLLGRQDRDRVTVGRRFEGGVADARDALPGGLALGGALGGVHPRPCRPGITDRGHDTPRGVERLRRHRVRDGSLGPSGWLGRLRHRSRPLDSGGPPGARRVVTGTDTSPHGCRRAGNADRRSAAISHDAPYTNADRLSATRMG